MHVITTTADLTKACDQFAAADFVAVDTEFMRESTYWPQLCLIQLACPGFEAVVDPMAPGLDLAAFYRVMSNPSVMKVFHAARQDIEIMFEASGNVPAPVFDSQVAAAVTGFGDSISYVNLVKVITGADIDKSSRFTDWSRRPLSEKQLVYALGDVTHLRQVYLHLKEKLDRENRTSWIEEEMAGLTDPATYFTKPEDAWRRLKLKVKSRKALGVLIEVAAWRERLAQSQNVPRGRVLRDDAIYDIANQAPQTPEQLSQLRTLSDGFAKSQRAKDIIEAVKAGVARDPKTMPALNHSQPLSAEATATTELLKVLLKSAAARNRVAPRYIADAEDLERIASDNSPDVLALKSAWRLEVFGNDALRLKRGELALTLKDGEVTTIDVTG